ncbi:MAG: response regulator [Litorimonas sp.]
MNTVFSGDVLIVEDNFIIAMDVEALVLDLGADTVHLASNCADALSALERADITYAILDFNLEGETSEPVAEALEAAGTPFVFATGYSDSSQLPERFRGLPILRKPYAAEEIRAVLRPAETSDADACADR